jgi:ribosome-associated protein
MKKVRAAAPQADSAAPRPVVVREVPIELCQFLKFGGLSETGGQAKQLIADGEVLLNGAVETQKRKKLAVGDVVEAGGQSIVVRLA